MNNNRNYIGQVRRPNPTNFFILKWGGIILRNVNNEGVLVPPCSTSKNIENKIHMWVLLKLKIFKNLADDTNGLLVTIKTY